MQTTHTGGNKIEFFDNLIYGDYFDQKYIERCCPGGDEHNRNDKNNKETMIKIKKEKLKCIVSIKLIVDYYKNSIPDYKQSYYNLKMNEMIDFKNFDKWHYILYDSIEIHFTENYLIYDFCYKKIGFRDRSTELIKIIEIPFTESLKKHIISYFSQSFLEDYQTNVIYPKYQKHLFYEDLIKHIITEFLECFKNRKTKEKLNDEIKKLEDELKKLKMEKDELSE